MEIETSIWKEFQKRCIDVDLTNTKATELAMQAWVIASKVSADPRLVVLIDALDNGDKNKKAIIEGAVKDWEPKYKKRLEEQRTEQQDKPAARKRA